MVDKIADFLSTTDSLIDGIVLLIDEADQPTSEAALGKTLKALTERLTRAGAERLLVGMAGLPSVLERLSESHPSSPRLFETMFLQPLETDEIKNIVNSGIASANKKNEDDVSIDEIALEFLVDLSEGYPHFVQQFSYCAFDQDKDNVIGLDDVIDGAYKENGAIDQLGRKFFNEMYYTKIGSDDYRKVLDTMAERGDEWISRKELIEDSGIKSTTINNAVNALKSRNIILVDSGRAGYYRLPTRSFAAWINAVKSVEGKKPERR